MKLLKKYLNNLLDLLLRIKDSKYERTFLSISFLIVGIFLFLLIGSIDSKEYASEYNARIILSSICIVAWFFTMPILDYNKKEKLFIGYIKTFFMFIFNIFILWYWLQTSRVKAYGFSFFAFDLLFLIAFLVTVRHIIIRFYNIFRTFLHYISLLSNKLFNHDKNPTGFIYFIERLTTILISISGILGTILAIATSLKALINIRN